MPRFPEPAPTSTSLSSGVFSALTERARHHPRPVCPLHVGDTWREPLDLARAEAQRTAETPHLHTYSPVAGEPALREAIERHLARRLAAIPGPLADGLLDTEARPRCVISGATSGLSVVVQALLSPGDELLLPAPFWPLIRGITASRGATAVEVPLFHDLTTETPPEVIEAALERAVTPRTAALYLNTPHNPTGRVLTRAQIGAFARVAARHDLWLLCDEVYEALHFGETPPTPAWALPETAPRAVAVHSMSKAFGLAGARVGWVHGPMAAMRAITAVQTFQVYCAARPMQLGAAAALDHGESWLAETRAIYRQASEAVARVFRVPAPEAGTFLFAPMARFLKPGETPEAFLIRLLDEADVLVTPGSASGRDFEPWVRVCFTAAPPEALAAALERLARVLG